MSSNTVEISNGRRFHYEGSRNWRASSDERWEIRTGDAVKGRKLGERYIDGARCVVVRIAGGHIVAAQAQYVR